MPLTAVNGVGLLVEESGSGEPLVLVHGSWDSRAAWALVEEELAQAFRVVSYDRRGHSGSDAATGSRTDDEDDLAALIEDNDLAPAHVVGNSFGACVALGLATRRPDLVRSLCGHEPPFFALVADHPAVAAASGPVGNIIELIDAGRHEEAARRFVEDIALGPGAWEMLPPDTRAILTRNATTFAEEVRDPTAAAIDVDALVGLTCPVLLTEGDQSPPHFAAIIARLAEAMDQAQVRTLAGAGHIPHITHPAEWVAVVREFGGAAAG